MKNVLTKIETRKSGEIVEYIYGKNNKQRSDVFYCDGYGHNLVAKVSFNNSSISIYCDGDMNFLVGDTRVRNNSYLEEVGIFTDEDLKRLFPDDWVNNPWFDAYLDEHELYPEELHLDGHLDMVNGDIEDAIGQAIGWLHEYHTTKNNRKE